MGKYRRGQHPNSLKALRPATAGEVRNPAGLNGQTAPKVSALALLAAENPELREVLAEQIAWCLERGQWRLSPGRLSALLNRL